VISSARVRANVGAARCRKFPFHGDGPDVCTGTVEEASVPAVSHGKPCVHQGDPRPVQAPIERDWDVVAVGGSRHALARNLVRS
jgi:hypothetical protein